MSDEHLSVPETARRLGISPTTLRAWMRDADFPLPALKLRHQTRFSARVIDEYLANAQRKPVAS